MNWEAAGAIGEIVGSIAVLITLIYLAIQVRQNTRHVRAQMGHEGWLATTANIVAVMGDDAATALGPVEQGLEGREYLAGGFSAADCMLGHSCIMVTEEMPNLKAYMDRLLARPACAEAFAA